MKIKQVSKYCFRIKGDGPKQIYIYPRSSFDDIMGQLCDLALSPEEIGKAVILMSSSTPEEEAKNLEINYESEL